ncbi:MAG: transcriptional regulator [Firmicutes bacterium]|nr:transcriptional regulator [Bacillota bacterium]
MDNQEFYTAPDILKIFPISRTHAYKIIRQLNAELEKKGYITVRGRISKKYIEERMFL